MQDNGGTANNGIDTSTANTLTINVTPVNDAPAGSNASVTALEDVAYAFKAADFGFTDANDSPANTLANVIITSLPVSGDLKLGGVAVTLNQVIPVASIANLTFTGAPNANGSNYASFGFKVQDNGGTANNGIDTSTPNTLTINVTPVNDLTDGSESVTTVEDTAISGNVLANSVNPDGPAVASVTTFTVAGDNTVYPAGQTATMAGIGTLIINSDGSYIFTPAANYAGVVPETTYSVTDGLATVASTLTIAITPVNDLTDASESVTTLEGTPVSGNVLANSVNPDGPAAASVTTFTVAGDATVYTAGQTATLAGVGTLVINSNGSYTFTPAANYAGVVPVTTYSVTDGLATVSSTLTIAIQNHQAQALHIEKFAIVADGTADKVGELINYTMAVTKTGNAAISNVQVDDPFTSNEAPVLSGLFNIGDTNSDGLLDVGETWQYTASHALTQAEIDAGTNIVNTATVTGDNAIPDAAAVSTPVVQNPALELDKVTVYAGQTGDGLTGVVAGNPISWNYSVTNTGNVSLSNISVQDDNGTASNNADNFFANPVLSGSFNVGDSNADGKLNPGEVWHFTASGIAIDGSYSNIGTASGSIGATTVTATDVSSYSVTGDCGGHGGHDGFRGHGGRGNL